MVRSSHSCCCCCCRATSKQFVMIIKTTAHLACPDHTHGTHHDTHAKQAMPYFSLSTKFVHYFSANRSPSAKLLLLPFLIENNNNNTNNFKPAIIITKQRLKLYWITTCPVSPPHTHSTLPFLLLLLL